MSNCGLQKLLVHFDLFYRLSTENKEQFNKLLSQRPEMAQLYGLWFFSGRPTSGLWNDLYFMDHDSDCCCGNGEAELPPWIRKKQNN